MCPPQGMRLEITIMGSELNPEQKRYLEGFASGMLIARSAASPRAAPTAPETLGPDAPALQAAAAVEAAGKKLSDPEKWKRAENPLDAWPRLHEMARNNQFPTPQDNFRWRYYGLFYVAPAQDSFMLRMRIANGILSAAQFEACAELARKYGDGLCAVTTRANLQIRGIKALDAATIVENLQDIGLTGKGSGADNIRNVTGSPTAGIDAQELLDTRPLARQWHFHILSQRALYGLPRKFNVAFDGGGCVPVLEETNDVGFQAVAIDNGSGAPRIACRLVLGGISGHKDLARDTGIICAPEQCTALADAIIRVFIETGDRTDRNKARLKYVLDSMGFDAFLARVEKRLTFPLERVPYAQILPRAGFVRDAHIGVHKQVQEGLNWLGVVVPVGRLEAAQMQGLAAVSRKFGDGDIRLTVWQNLLISGVADADVAAATAAIEALGLAIAASPIRRGLVACTGAKGCKFAAADTKGHALEIAAHVEASLHLDLPVNLHLTGCHNSCAQHYIGDIGLIGAKVPVNEDGDTVEGYDIVVGGGFADNPKIGRPVVQGVKASDCPQLVTRLLAAWLEGRTGKDESFFSFANRHTIEELQEVATGARNP